VKNQHSNKIIFFDGVCALCNGSVRWVIKHDVHQVFKYAPLQGETAKTKLAEHNLKHLNSIILLDGDQIYTQSTAALKVAKLLPAPYCGLYVLAIIPSVIRDFVYDYIAKHRYTWFGQYDKCTIPSKENKELFLD